MTKRLLLRSLGVAALLLAACGSDPGVDRAVSGTVEIEMKDIAFSPATLTVKAGEPIHLVFKNTGKLDHEAIIGNGRMQDQHEQDMKDGSSDHGDMGHSSEMGADALTVKPGKTGELTYTFKATDDGIIIGCHEQGHYAAGMKTKVSVEA